MLEDIISPISLLIFIISIIIFASSIKNKNKKFSIINIVACVLYFIYENIFLYLVISYFNINIGLNMLLVEIANFITSAILVISVVVNIVKLSKPSKRQKNASVKNLSPYMVCLAIVYAIGLLGPIFSFFGALSSEQNVLSRADLILFYDYQNGINSEHTLIAVSSNQCSIISNSNLYESIPSTQLRSSSYTITFENGVSNIKSYDDQDLSNVNIEKMKYIAHDAIDRVDWNGDDDLNDRIEIEIQELGDSDYYFAKIINWPADKPGTLLAKSIYKGTSYHCDIPYYVSGGLERAILLDN